MAACDGATRSTTDALVGLGPQLLLAGAPAVLAMQGSVTIETARQFSARFYTRLLDHGIVDLAANEARSMLLTAKRPDARAPVLFMRLVDGLLLARPAADPSLPPALTYVPPDPLFPPGSEHAPCGALKCIPGWRGVICSLSPFVVVFPCRRTTRTSRPCAGTWKGWAKGSLGGGGGV